MKTLLCVSNLRNLLSSGVKYIIHKPKSGLPTRAGNFKIVSGKTHPLLIVRHIREANQVFALQVFVRTTID